MNLLIAVLASAAGVMVFFAWAKGRTAKAHRRFTPRDVETALTEVLDPHARDHDTWDLFLAWSISDPYLESIRHECLMIREECPPVPGKDINEINEEGQRRVAALLADLRRGASVRGAHPLQ
jgi:hypothetical protein